MNKSYPINLLRLVRAKRAWQQVNRALPYLSDEQGHALIASTKAHLAGPRWRDPLPALPAARFFATYGPADATGYLTPRAANPKERSAATRQATRTKRRSPRGFADRRGKR